MTNSLENMVKDMGRYVITAAQRGARLNHDFYDSLNIYANHVGAEMLILPMKGKYVEYQEAEKREQEQKTFRL